MPPGAAGEQPDLRLASARNRLPWALSGRRACRSRRCLGWLGFRWDAEGRLLRRLRRATQVKLDIAQMLLVGSRKDEIARTIVLAQEVQVTILRIGAEGGL